MRYLTKRTVTQERAMTNILVLGASRGIGREVCRAATDRGHHVRAFSRSGTVPRGAQRAEPFKGDALEAADVARALDGIDVVVQVLGVKISPALLTEPDLPPVSKAVWPPC